MATRDDKTPTWLIERLAAGELDAPAADAVRRRLADEGRSADDELAALGRSNREILEAHPPAGVATEVRRRAIAEARRRARPRRTLVLGGALVAAGALALVLLPRPSPGPRGTTPGALEETGIKGSGALRDPRLYVYRHGAAGDRRLGDGEAAARGDLLQLAYAAPERAFGVLLSIDGAGRVTQHWPEPGSARAVPLYADREVRLPSSYELDDAPGFERFFLVVAPQPFDVAPVLHSARALSSQPPAARHAPLPLAPGFAQVSLALDKPRRAPSQKTQETP
jgi:hypothetical protein